jgi:hypothetical protein
MSIAKYCSLALIALTLGAAGTLRADNTNTVGVDFQNGGSIAYAGYYVGPYNFLLTMANTNVQVALVCTCFTNEIYNGETWTAKLETFNDISTSLNPSNLQGYQEIGWLYNYGVANPSQWGPVNYAIWAVFQPSATEANGGWSSQSATLLSEAQSQTFTSGEFANLAILTPTPAGPQEFIGVIPGVSQPSTPSTPGPTPTPEPANYLAVTGLVGAVWTIIRRRQRA